MRKIPKIKLRKKRKKLKVVNNKIDPTGGNLISKDIYDLSDIEYAKAIKYFKE